MNYSNIFKKQTFMVVSVICVVMIVFIGISYALFTKNLQGENLVVKSGDLKVIFTSGNVINGDLMPLSDKDGQENGSEYAFEINNTGTLKASYAIEIYEDGSVEGTHIPHDCIKISYDGETSVTLSELEKVSGENENDSIYVVDRSEIETGEANKQNHSIRMWIKSDAPTTIIGNVVAYKIKVVSEVGK